MLPKRHPDVVHEVIDGRAVLVDAAGTELITLNEAGSLIWAELDGATDLATLYRAFPQWSSDDVDAFLAELADAGLLATS